MICCMIISLSLIHVAAGMKFKGVLYRAFEETQPMFLLHTHHHITFSLFCYQGNTKISALSKPWNQQEDKQTQPIGEFESLLLFCRRLSMTVLMGGRCPLIVPCVET